MAYPAPDDYKSWQEYARALVGVLSEGEQDPSVFSYAGRVPEPPPVVIPPPNPSYPPAGWYPVWYNQAEAEMFLGNTAFDPPVAADLFNIDTAQLADAAVTTSQLANLAVDSSKLADLAVDAAKLADSAVTATKIANLAVGSAAIQALAVGTAHIANAAIISAKIADLAVVTAKIDDLAVNSAKIANLAVTSAKIANLAVGVAHIQDAAISRAKIGFAAVGTAQIEDGTITNAKIGQTIQSTNWNSGTKSGWLIDKAGVIYGQGINIYDASGNLVFGAGGSIDWSRVVGVGRPQDFATLGAQLGVNFKNGAGGLETDTTVLNRSIIVDGVGRLSNIGTAGVYVDNTKLQLYGSYGQLGLANNGTPTDVVNLADAGVAAFAYLNALTAGNASTYIAAGAIGTAQIGLAAITTALIADASIIRAKIGLLAVGTAQIGDLAVTQAKIGLLAVGAAQIEDAAITNAKIGNAAITNAKIGNLEVDNAKIANLTVGTGKIQYAATAEVFTFYSGYMGIPTGTAGVWKTLAYGGVNAQLIITPTSDNQQVVLELCMSVYRNDSDDDILGFRILRTDGVALGQQYMNIRVPTGNVPFTFLFTDPTPGNGVARTYQVQYNPNATNEVPQFGDVTLRGSLVKR